MNVTTKCFTRKGREYKIVRAYWPDGTLAYEHHYRDGERHGVWRGWYPDGSLRYKDQWRDGKLVNAENTR